MTRRAKTLVAVVGALLLAGCGGGDPTTPPPPVGGDRLFGIDDSDPAILYEIDRTTGAATARTANGLAAFDSIAGLDWDTTTGRLYGSDIATDRLVEIDPATGEGTAKGPLGFGSVTGLAFDPNTATLYGVDRDTRQILRIDRTTGAGTAVATIAGLVAGDFVEGLAFDRVTGNLWAANAATDEVLEVDPATGSVGVVLDGRDFGGLAFDATGRYVYGTERITNRLYRIYVPQNRTTLVHEHYVPGTEGLAYDGSTGRLFATKVSGNGSALFQIDRGTARATSIGSTGFAPIEGLAEDPVSGTLYGVHFVAGESGELLAIDRTTGATTPVARLGPIVRGLAHDAGRRTLCALAWVGAASQLYPIDPATGALGSEIPLAPVLGEAHGLAAGPENGGTLYTVVYTGGSGAFTTIDPATGATATVGAPLAGLGQLRGLAYDPARSGFLFASDAVNRKLYSLTTGGVATEIGSTGVSITGLALGN
jgi:DNA-binding beta-propeller fold protein YncE